MPEARSFQQMLNDFPPTGSLRLEQPAINAAWRAVEDMEEAMRATMDTQLLYGDSAIRLTTSPEYL